MDDKAVADVKESLVHTSLSHRGPSHNGPSLDAGPAGAPSPDGSTPRISVLVSDGQRLFAQALAAALHQFGDLAVIAEHPPSGREIVEAVIRHDPDVALVDYWMIDMGGPAITRAIHAWSPGPKVLLLSWLHGPIQVEDALSAGAAGFLPKSITLGHLVEAIRAAHAGTPLVYANELAKLVNAIRQRGQEAEERWRRLMTLSPREVEILHHLAQGLPAKQLARQLQISVGTLRNHTHSIMKKTGARSQLEAINMARHEGLIGDVAPPTPPPLPSTSSR